MRVLWLCNVVAPQFREQLGLPISFGGGWIEQTLDKLIDTGVCEIAYCAPMVSNSDVVRSEYRGVKFYGFSQKKQPEQYDRNVESIFKIVLEEFSPDVVHIFGTEFPHALAMVRAFGNPERIVVHLQGIMTYIAQCYDVGIPHNIVHGYTFRDFIKNDNIFQQKCKFEKRAEYERQTLNSVSHVMGRTAWDKACVELINPKINYHHCAENLRAVFYEDKKWDLDNCEKHSLFMSQGSYPVKGLHLALEALQIIKKSYPNVKLYVAGDDIARVHTLTQRLRQNSYSKYIVKLITMWNLQENIEFVGSLSAQQMRDMYLKCNAYIIPSVIENSPNSLCEALFLGVPAVAAYVGGIPEFIEHGKNGYLYQCNAPYMLAHYVETIFENENFPKTWSAKMQHTVREKESLEENIETLLDIYCTIIDVMK